MWLQCFWWKSTTGKRCVSDICPGFPLTQAAAPFLCTRISVLCMASISPRCRLEPSIRMFETPWWNNPCWLLRTVIDTCCEDPLCFLLEILNHCKNLDDVPQSQFFSTVLKLNRKHLPRNLRIPSLHPPLSQKIQKLLHPATLSLHFSQANANVLSSG